MRIKLRSRRLSWVHNNLNDQPWIQGFDQFLLQRKHLGDHTLGIFYDDIFSASIPEVRKVFADLLPLHNTLVGNLHFQVGYLPTVLHVFEDFVSSPFKFGIECDAVILNFLCVVFAFVLSFWNQLICTK
tara:strand:+ start:326 stop:712 length:387 start_codon:yes stop_codon:yes gene_type:complete